ncbi:MAG: isoprenylcysteine carboxylmethyltransferase family protein [Bryobacterales bacterium]|nr:isoprenylcysteine carboxylmethyltransferase family protein [Bryobacterales bacterium]
MEFSPIRLYLLAGLVLHKAVWEILKWRGPRVERKTEIPLKSRIVSLVKVVILAGVILQTVVPEIAPIFSNPKLPRAIGTGVYTAGLLMAILARVQLGRNWSDIEKSQVRNDHALVAHGLYKLVRHPIYAGDLLLLLGLEMALNSWAVLGVVALVLYVRRKAAAEERALAKTLPGYGEYCKRTARFLPFLPG